MILDLFVINSPLYWKTFLDTLNIFEVSANIHIRGKQTYFGNAAGAEKDFFLAFYWDWPGRPLGNGWDPLYLWYLATSIPISDRSIFSPFACVHQYCSKRETSRFPRENFTPLILYVPCLDFYLSSFYVFSLHFCFLILRIISHFYLEDQNYYCLYIVEWKVLLFRLSCVLQIFSQLNNYFGILLNN